MKTKIKILFIAALFLLTACAKPKNFEEQIAPLMGLSWFMDIGEVKDSLTDLDFVKERETGKDEKHQFLIDYENAELFELDCTLTVCCTGQGFVGLNYHDTEKSQSYNEWFDQIEAIYGVPTEQGGGMASWYEDPIGKNTALYLFNLEDCVQVSFYATSATPDKSYAGSDGEQNSDVYVPTPEIRSPIIPVKDTPLHSGAQNDKPTQITDAQGSIIEAVSETETSEEHYSEDIISSIETSPVKDVKITTTTSKVKDRLSKVTTTTVIAKRTEIPKQSTVPNEKTTIPDDHTKDFLLNGLEFYGTPDSERTKMSRYTQLYEYRIEEPDQPWELIMEYENVSYQGKSCDAALCFTSLGLVGVNYFDSNTSNYNYWVQELTDIYGTPSETQYDYTAWSEDPVGSGTMIYVFALEDGVQISFFADDTGSELA